jgi:hypothetical protein
MTTAPTNRRSWPRPRFSLRALLLAFTAFAVGFPIWWRWPYEEVEIPARTPDWTVITTWQRQWGGGRLKHGPERRADGFTISTVVYCNGVRHGPFVYDDMLIGAHVEGRYENGLQHGTWTRIDNIEGQNQVTYDHGKQISH